MINRKALKIIAVGLLVMVLTQIISHYFEIPDILYGFLMGSSLGLMILGLIKRKIKISSTNQD